MQRGKKVTFYKSFRSKIHILISNLSYGCNPATFISLFLAFITGFKQMLRNVRAESMGGGGGNI